MKKSFGEDSNIFVNILTNIQNVIPKTNKKMWPSCADECYTVCKNEVERELGSTAFMLRILTNSFISGTEIVQGRITFNFLGDINKPMEQILTGQWANDSQYFQMNFPSKLPGRLIMGLGPSSSGKTRNAKLIIKLMAKLEPNYPSFFSLSTVAYFENCRLFTKQF